MNQTRKARTTLVIVAALAIGVLLAIWIERRNSNPQIINDTSSTQTIISQIVLAKLADPKQSKEDNPSLKQDILYTTEDYIALRVTTQPSITKSIQMGARLLTREGRIVELDPPSMTLPPGESTFCCWIIDEPNEYTLQLFRPEGIISSIPLKIRKALSAPARNSPFNP